MAPHHIWLLQTQQTSIIFRNIFWVYQVRVLQSSTTLLRSANVRASPPPTFPPKQHHQAWTDSYATTWSPWVTPQSSSVLFFHAKHFYTVSLFVNRNRNNRKNRNNRNSRSLFLLFPPCLCKKEDKIECIQRVVKKKFVFFSIPLLSNILFRMFYLPL